MIEIPVSTREASRLLGESYARVYGLIQRREILLPPRDGTGRFLWYAADLERARRALAEAGNPTHPEA